MQEREAVEQSWTIVEALVAACASGAVIGFVLGVLATLAALVFLLRRLPRMRASLFARFVEGAKIGHAAVRADQAEHAAREARGH